jgi:hypothetical protein
LVGVRWPFAPGWLSGLLAIIVRLRSLAWWVFNYDLICSGVAVANLNLAGAGTTKIIPKNPVVQALQEQNYTIEILLDCMQLYAVVPSCCPN